MPILCLDGEPATGTIVAPMTERVDVTYCLDGDCETKQIVLRADHPCASFVSSSICFARTASAEDSFDLSGILSFGPVTTQDRSVEYRLTITSSETGETLYTRGAKRRLAGRDTCGC